MARARAIRDAAALGLQLELAEAPQTGLWAEHAAAWEVWLAVCGQWRTAAAGMGGLVWLGLDYGAAQAGLALAGLSAPPAVWEEVRVIEAGARDELNRER